MSGQQICSYSFTYGKQGEPAPHMLTAKEACEQFDLSTSALFWLCLGGMPFHELCNPTDVHPETMEYLDKEGVTTPGTLGRRSGLSLTFPTLDEPITQLKFDLIQGNFWGGLEHSDSIKASIPSEYAAFSQESETSWQATLSGKGSTGAEFIAEGAKQLNGVITYQSKNPSDICNLNLSLHVDVNQCMYGVMSMGRVHFFPVPSQLIEIAKIVRPPHDELDCIRLSIMEGFCLCYMFVKGFSFSEMVKVNPKYKEGIENKLISFTNFWNHFFLFDPADIRQAISETVSVSDAFKEEYEQNKAEFERLQTVALNSKHCNSYQAKQWLDFKATTTDKNEQNLAETAALMLKGEPLKYIADIVWKYESVGKSADQATKFISDKRKHIRLLAELHGLPPLPKNPRGAKKKK